MPQHEPPRCQPLDSELIGHWAHLKFKEAYVAVVRLPKDLIWDAHKQQPTKDMNFFLRILASKRVPYEADSREGRARLLFIPFNKMADALRLQRRAGELMEWPVSVFVEGRLVKTN